MCTIYHGTLVHILGLFGEYINFFVKQQIFYSYYIILIMTDTYTFMRLFTWAKNRSFFVKLISMTFASFGMVLNSQMYPHHNFRNIKMLTVLHTILNKLGKQLIFFVQSKVKFFL